MIEVDDSSEDYGFIDKYIREDSNNVEGEANASRILNRFKIKESGTVEVFGSVGEGENRVEQNEFNKGKSYGDRNWNNRTEDESELDGGNEETVKKKISEARKEFLNEIQEDNESLTIDTCSKLTHDWKK